MTGAVVGAGIGFGWLPPLLTLAFAATFAAPTPSGTDALISGIMAALGVGYGIVIAHRFGTAPVIEGDRLPVKVAAVVALVFGAALGAAAALGVALGWTEPYWVPEPIIILALYIVTGKRDRIRGKAIGTAAGAGAALPVAILAPSVWVTSAIATVAFIAALTQANRYWLMYGLYTFALVLALASPARSPSKLNTAASKSLQASPSSSSASPSSTPSATASCGTAHNPNSPPAITAANGCPHLARPSWAAVTLAVGTIWSSS